jgi:hypothetical protein
MVEAHITWNYTTWLNVVFLGLAALLVWWDSSMPWMMFWPVTMMFASCDHIDAEPGSTDQVVHFSVKVTAPADPVSIRHQLMLRLSNPGFRQGRRDISKYR